MTGASNKGSYCGVVNIYTVGVYLFFRCLNYIEVDVADFWNCYLHDFTNYNIYNVEVPEFGAWEEHVLICVISIYGLKTFIARFHEVILDRLKMVGFRP